MSFQDAIKACLNKFAVFDGRARRSEFWWFALFQFLAQIVAGIIDRVIGTGSLIGPYGLVSTVVWVGLLIPALAVGSRRLHDTGRSGWWQLLSIIPLVGWVILIVWWAMEGNPGDNEHGPSPKGIGGGATQPGWGAPTQA